MPKRPITAEDLLRLTFVGDPQVSPDGHRILFTRKTVDVDKNKYVTNLFTVDLDGHTKQWTSGDAGAGHGRWSADGKQIAFISGREGKKAQIFLIPADGGEALKLTSLPEGSVGDFKWSPDGSKIAFTFRETDPLWTEKAKKEREEKCLSTPPRVINKEWYRLDGDGYFLDQRYAVYVVDTKSGEHRKLYDADRLGAYSFDWSPDSNELVIAHSVAERPMFDKAHDGIFRVDMDGQAWRLENQTKGNKENLRWSPDGKWIGYLGSEHDDGWGCLNNRLWVLPADGSATATCLSPDDDYCLSVGAMSDCREVGDDGILEWSPDSKALYVAVGWHGQVQIGYAVLGTPGINLLTKGNHAIQVGNVSRDGEKIACTFGTPLKPNEIAVYDLAKHEDAPEVLTHFNRDFVEEIKFSEPEELYLDNPDGGKVHVWVMNPIDYLEPKRYPAVLEIHGGPHAQYGWQFFHEFQLLAAQGYVVVYSNPRGSKGYGEEHCKAIKGHWGNKDWDDIETVIRWMQHQPNIQPGVMGVMGGSYGGYMTNWVVGHTDIFKAAITDRCVSNLATFGGNHDFIQAKDHYWKGVFFGDITDLWRDSPIKYFENVKTPMLVIHSEGDLRCNIEQSEQVYSALCHLGVEARFVRYPQSSSHGLSRGGPPDLRLHRLGEIVSWWEKHLK